MIRCPTNKPGVREELIDEGDKVVADQVSHQQAWKLIVEEIKQLIIRCPTNKHGIRQGLIDEGNKVVAETSLKS